MTTPFGHNPYSLEFTLVKEFGKVRFYPENALGRALLDVAGSRSLTHTQVRILAAHFDIHIREGRLEPVPFSVIESKLGGNV